MKRAWDFLASITLTIILAAAICLVAAVGSLITVANQRFFSALDTSVLFPSLLELGTSELRLTLWVWALIILTTLFTLNTVVCTADKVVAILKNRRPVQALFPHIVHVGFLIAVLGHLVGSVWGFKAPGNILYKDSVVPVPETPGLSMRLDEFEVRQSGNNPPDMLRSRLTLFEDTEKGMMEIRTGDIEINSPLIHNGIAFYHMNQGVTPTGLVLESNGEFKEIPFYSDFTLGGVPGYSLGAIYPDFVLTADGRPASRSSEYNNPYITVLSPGGAASYLSVAYPGSRVELHGDEGQTIEAQLIDYAMSEYVVLNINRDPGIYLIIAGSAVLVIGMLLLLFFRGPRSEIVRKSGYV